MKTIIITGSARGFGYSMAKYFYENNHNIVICDINEIELEKAKKNLSKIKSTGNIYSYIVDVTKEEDINNMIHDLSGKVESIDILINNAGVNQPMKNIWELDSQVINRLIDIDLKGTILCSKIILPVFIKQGYGAIYNVEGHGSNDATIPGLSIYGTAKRGVTYFTEALAKEVKDTGVIVGKITPGIMITNFIDTSLGDGEKIKLDEKTKNVYNILGDKPDVIAKYMVGKIESNTKNNVQFIWLTPLRAMHRFIRAIFGIKNNYFS